MLDELTSAFIVKKNGEDKGKIYRYLGDGLFRKSGGLNRAYYTRSPEDKILIDMDQLKRGEGDYEVYEPKIGDNILPFKETDYESPRGASELRDNPMRLYRNEKGFIINSIVEVRNRVYFILRDKETGNQIEQRFDAKEGGGGSGRDGVLKARRNEDAH